MRFALVPTVPELDDKSKAALHEGVRSRWAKFLMIAAALLLISGIANLGLAARYEFGPPVGKLYNMPPTTGVAHCRWGRCITRP